MIPDCGSEGWEPSPCFFDLGRSFLARLSLSVGLFASLERFAVELVPSELDFARPDPLRDALDVLFGDRNGVFARVLASARGFVASIDFVYDVRVFWQWFFDRLSARFSITSSIVFAFDRRRSCCLKPRKTLAGAMKINVRR